ncbi:MAG: hypothetical protein RLZZ383_2109 [Pseudomonadota bacterium]|jgi:MoaA/NifB/PqqE/SkfB family radical SAM enzyme
MAQHAGRSVAGDAAEVSRRDAPSATLPEVRLVVTARSRAPVAEGLAQDGCRLDHDVPEGDRPADAPADAVVAAGIAAWQAGANAVVLWGGEPTLRPDFPAMVRALREGGVDTIGVATDGLAFGQPDVAARLVGLGLSFVRFRFHSARPDAQDWLTGVKGSLRRTAKAMEAVAAAGLGVEVEAVVTRPTVPHLAETVELAARLGARRIHLRRVTARGAAALDDVALMPRLGLVQTELESAAQAGVRQGARVFLEGFPQCTAPGAAPCRLDEAAVRVVVADAPGWVFVGPMFGPVVGAPGCGRCPGAGACGGAPSDYLARFGRTEVDGEGAKWIHPGTLPPTPLANGDVKPVGRQGRHPPLRLAYAKVAARLPSHGGDPLVAVSKSPSADVIRTLFVAPPRVRERAFADLPAPAAAESTRDVRIRLVRAAQHGASTLRIASAGTLAHPAAAEMLREATRLEIPRIEVAGEASAVAGWGDMELRRLRGIHRLDAALYAPDAATHDAIVGIPGAFEATLAALDRAGEAVPGLAVGAYAVLRDASEVLAWAQAWDDGLLPGDPFFRLASVGGDLAELAAAAASLPRGPARDALAAVLPVALLPRDGVKPAPEATVAFGEFAAVWAAPSGSDRFGCYTGRLAREGGPVAGDCPGWALGWRVHGRPVGADGMPEV